MKKHPSPSNCFVSRARWWLFGGFFSSFSLCSPEKRGRSKISKRHRFCNRSNPQLRAKDYCTFASRFATQKWLWSLSHYCYWPASLIFGSLSVGCFFYCFMSVFLHLWWAIAATLNVAICNRKIDILGKLRRLIAAGSVRSWGKWYCRAWEEWPVLFLSYVFNVFKKDKVAKLWKK